ncbi:hypothetical protein LOAG_02845 [Loa loa]|uniref:ShKT domain-containing protein n=1 Tax=Loa loa TaxID=7209 RepID=A0A1S0U5Z1_LOALO|nr:hypothetical protein LOAG_02845 [Loa loa]EFO25638.1 hypothetical protein LOAG_02845 [Loa loa]
MQSRIQNFAGVAFARLFSAERIPRRLHDHLQKTNKARKGTYNAIRQNHLIIAMYYLANSMIICLNFPGKIFRRPYTINCDMEVDDKGDLCQEWAKANLCDTNRATMFLFCRRTCLCVGPPTNIPP